VSTRPHRPAPGVGQDLAGLELRHRQHARVEDRTPPSQPRRWQTCLPPLRRERSMVEYFWRKQIWWAWTNNPQASPTHPDLASYEIDTVRTGLLNVDAASPRRRTDPDPCASRRHLALGPKHLKRMANRLRAASNEPVHRPSTEDPTRPWQRRPAEAPGDCRARMQTISPISRPAPAPSARTARETSRLTALQKRPRRCISTTHHSREVDTKVRISGWPR